MEYGKKRLREKIPSEEYPKMARPDLPHVFVSICLGNQKYDVQTLKDAVLTSDMIQTQIAGIPVPFSMDVGRVLLDTLVGPNPMPADICELISKHFRLHPEELGEYIGVLPPELLAMTGGFLPEREAIRAMRVSKQFGSSMEQFQTERLRRLKLLRQRFPGEAVALILRVLTDPQLSNWNDFWDISGTCNSQPLDLIIRRSRGEYPVEIPLFSVFVLAIPPDIFPIDLTQGKPLLDADAQQLQTYLASLFEQCDNLNFFYRGWIPEQLVGSHLIVNGQLRFTKGDLIAILGRSNDPLHTYMMK